MFYYFYQSAMAFSLLASLFMLVLAWRHRSHPGAAAMAALAAATFIWTLGFFIEANSVTLEQQLFFNNIGYIGVMSTPVAWLLFALDYTNDNRSLTGWKILLLCIVPLVTVALVWSNNSHHLMWYDERLTTSGPFTVTAKTYGPFFWIAFVYNYILVITGATLLIRRLLIGVPLYRSQAFSLIVAVALPLVWNFIYIFKLTSLPRKDLTPVMFSISGIVIILGVLRFQLLSAVPFARKFLIQRLRDGILAFDTDKRLLEANLAAQNMFGVDKSVIGRSVEDLPSLSPVLERLSTVGSNCVELRLTVSGEERFYELNTELMRVENERPVGWLTILRDITASKRAEEEKAEIERKAQDASRMASIGEMAAGIAHEINNPLTPIIGFSEVLMKRDLPDDVKYYLEIIYDHAIRAADVTNGLLAFARPRQPVCTPCDINEVVESALRLRAYHLKANNINVFTELGSDLQTVMADKGQLQEVFLNLVLNAEYEMSRHHRGGNLLVKMERLDGIVRISVKDSGPGITKENLEKLFKPFFTTKPVGEGTGLGLSICHGIIAEHGGKIYAESEAGQGATFVVELPIVSS